MIAWSQMGDPNASIPTVEPVIMRPMFGAMTSTTSIAWVSESSVKKGVVGKYALQKRGRSREGVQEGGKEGYEVE